MSLTCITVVCLIACIILVVFISNIIHSCLVICVYAYMWVVMHRLCMFMFSCGQVYSDIMMVVFMHEVMVCVVVEVMHS